MYFVRIGNNARRRQAPDPLLTLFSNGEQGFWLDGLDITGLYQDTGGTTAVTTVGQDVRYVTDKSGNGHHSINAAGQWLASLDGPYNVLRSTNGNLIGMKFPNLGNVSGQLYVVRDGCKSLVANATMNVSNSGLKFADGYVAAIFIDRDFTSAELIALDALYKDPIVTNGGGYQGVFQTTGVTELLTDLEPIRLAAADVFIDTTLMFKDTPNLQASPVFTYGDGSRVTNMFENSGISEFDASSDVGVVENLFKTWYSCDDLISFPDMEFPACFSFRDAWRQSGLASFAMTNPPQITNVSFRESWYLCTDLTTFSMGGFPGIAGVSFEGAWRATLALASFSLGDMTGATGVNYTSAWRQTGLPTFPDMNLGDDYNASSAWYQSDIVNFLVDDLTGATNLSSAWYFCDQMTNFATTQLPTANIVYQSAWYGCSALSTFAANMFDSCLATNFNNAFRNCALDETSVDNILVSLDAAGQSNGVVHIGGGTNSAPGTAGATAVSNLIGKGWTVTTN